eukprot:TRINITY_DN21802_c0_g1_i1.p1 TRINITY_DN21802_c0_g1~~TRINITY_DN21802_c0_g1_i1.p1  ORF type:complete len:1095 (+),score=196.52 TRINITY_DN21802_c0_g1_i1:90-3374(+)
MIVNGKLRCAVGGETSRTKRSTLARVDSVAADIESSLTKRRRHIAVLPAIGCSGGASSTAMFQQRLLPTQDTKGSVSRDKRRTNAAHSVLQKLSVRRRVRRTAANAALHGYNVISNESGDGGGGGRAKRCSVLARIHEERQRVAYSHLTAVKTAGFQGDTNSFALRRRASKYRRRSVKLAITGGGMTTSSAKASKSPSRDVTFVVQPVASTAAMIPIKTPQIRGSVALNAVPEIPRPSPQLIQEVPVASLGKKAVKQALHSALKSAARNVAELSASAAVFRRLAGAAPCASSDGEDGVARKLARERVNELLELAATKGDFDQYIEIVAVCGQLKSRLDAHFFAKLLVLLTSRIPVPTEMVRLTLNFAIPHGGDVVPLLHAKSTQEELSAVSKAEHVDVGTLCGSVVIADTSIARYYVHFMILLHLEMLDELRDMERRFDQPNEAIAQRGDAAFALKVIDISSEKFKKSKVTRVPGKRSTARVRLVFDVPRANYVSSLFFRPGDSVLLSRSNPRTDFVAEGMITEIYTGDRARDNRKTTATAGESGCRLVVALDKCIDAEEAMNEVWRLDRAVNRTAYERQLLALLQLSHNPKRHGLCNLFFLSGIGCGKSGRVCAHESLEANELQRFASEVVQYQGNSVEEIQDFRETLLKNDSVKSLNSSQKAAVSNAVACRLTTIQGPPGTGKTHISAQILKLWSQIEGMKPLLATSDSNIAVDNIAEDAVKHGLKIVRLGRSERVTPRLESLTLENKLKDLQEEIEVNEMDFDHRESGAGQVVEEGDDSAFGSQQSWHRKMRILKEADVICTTTTTAGSNFLQGIDFGAILIDEVAQATELSCIVPVILRGGKQLVLVGDHCQLPPSVSSLEAKSRGLSISLFARLVAEGLKPNFLDTQFRMHPKIAEFSALVFYDGALHNGVDASLLPAPKGFPWPVASAGVAFIDAKNGLEECDGQSKKNMMEAEIVADIIGKVISAHELRLHDIGVVSPYAAQVRALRRAVKQRFSEQMSDANLTELEIASVDAFQGREKELIVFSAVRSNSCGKVGFLADWRRLNVALTRARRGLLVVGNSETLANDQTWKRWLDWANSSGFFVEVS